MRHITRSSQQTFPAQVGPPSAAELDVLVAIEQAEADRDYWRVKLETAADGIAGSEARLERLQVALARARAERVRKGKGR